MTRLRIGESEYVDFPDSKLIRDPKGRVRKIRCVRTDCAHAWVWAGLFRKIHQYAAPGADVVGNLVRRLEKKGWEVVE